MSKSPNKKQSVTVSSGGQIKIQATQSTEVVMRSIANSTLNDSLNNIIVELAKRQDNILLTEKWVMNDSLFKVGNETSESNDSLHPTLIRMSSIPKKIMMDILMEAWATLSQPKTVLSVKMLKVMDKKYSLKGIVKLFCGLARVEFQDHIPAHIKSVLAKVMKGRILAKSAPAHVRINARDGTLDLGDDSRYKLKQADEGDRYTHTLCRSLNIEAPIPSEFNFASNNVELDNNHSYYDACLRSSHRRTSIWELIEESHPEVQVEYVAEDLDRLVKKHSVCEGKSKSDDQSAELETPLPPATGPGKPSVGYVDARAHIFLFYSVAHVGLRSSHELIGGSSQRMGHARL